MTAYINYKTKIIQKIFGENQHSGQMSGNFN